MSSQSNRLFLLALAVVWWFPTHGSPAAQEPATEAEQPATTPPTPLDEEGRLIRFARDIAPILRSRCLECHGPEEAQNDFRVDDVDSLMEYIEAEDIESSTMYVDYLVTDDEEMLMPPESHDGPLSASELAVIRVWIEEGAHWPEGYELVAESVDGEAPEVLEQPDPPQTLPQRVWSFQGYLHPATIHFPIAFFLLGAMFVVLGLKWPAVGTQIPLACLLLGSLTAIVVTLMGWSFAYEQGFGSNWNPLDWDRDVDTHRWSGVIVSLVGAIFSVIAWMSYWKDNESMTKYWKIGLLVLAGMVGAVGHQGGEMVYGKDFYPKAFRILLGTEGLQQSDASAAETTGEPQTGDPPPGDPTPGEHASAEDSETSTDDASSEQGGAAEAAAEQ